MPDTYKSRLADDITAYLNLRGHLGYSVVLYSSNLRNLDSFCAENFPQEGTVSKAMVMSWIEMRDGECAGTQHIRASVIRKFSRFQSSEGKHAYILPEGILSPVRRYVPHVLNDDELARLFVAVDTLPPHHCSPDRAYVLPVAFRMMLCCGLRPGEPMRLYRADVDLEHAMLSVKDTKRHKNRIVAMSDDMARLCRAYDEHAGERSLFFERPKGGAYPLSWADYQMVKCLEHAGLAGLHVRPYDLRHRFATTVLMRWTDEGIDVQAMLPRLAEYMGHATIRDTAYYVHLLADRIAASPGIDWAAFTSLYPEVRP
jgi:integrase